MPRSIPILFLCLLILIALLIAIEVGKAEEIDWLVGNEMAAAHRMWAELRNARVEDPAKVGTINAKEIRAWQEFKRKERKLETLVDAEYRGR